jgi:hypothetical protein
MAAPGIGPGYASGAVSFLVLAGLVIGVKAAGTAGWDAVWQPAISSSPALVTSWRSLFGLFEINPSGAS